MARHADNLSYGDGRSTQRAIPPDVLNSMVAACGIVRRVAYLMNLGQIDQQLSARRPPATPHENGAAGRQDTQNDIISEADVEELFEEAIGSLGLSVEEVIGLWDLFLSASAGAKRHYQRRMSEQRQSRGNDSAGTFVQGEQEQNQELS